MKLSEIRKMTLFFMILTLMFSAAACGKEKSDSGSENAAETKAEEETQETVSGKFVSEDGKIEITLPEDGAWSCTSDVENMKTFQSEYAVINVVYAEGDGVENQMVPADEDAYRRMVNGGMADLAFDVVSFEAGSSDGVNTYQGIVHYTDAENPDKYTLHYGIYEVGHGYTATAVLWSEDEDLLAQVRDAVYSMQVLQ